MKKCLLPKTDNKLILSAATRLNENITSHFEITAANRTNFYTSSFYENEFKEYGHG